MQVRPAGVVDRTARRWRRAATELVAVLACACSDDPDPSAGVGTDLTHKTDLDSAFTQDTPADPGAPIVGKDMHDDQAQPADGNARPADIAESDAELPIAQDTFAETVTETAIVQDTNDASDTPGDVSANCAQLDCNDQNPCTVDKCDKATGCTVKAGPDGASCVAAGGCETGGACKAGKCEATGKPKLGVTKLPMKFTVGGIATTTDGAWLAVGNDAAGKPVALRQNLGGEASPKQLAVAGEVWLSSVVALDAGEAAVLGSVGGGVWWGRIDASAVVTASAKAKIGTESFLPSAMVRRTDGTFAVVGGTGLTGIGPGPSVAWLTDAGAVKAVTTVNVEKGAVGGLTQIAAGPSATALAVGSLLGSGWLVAFDAAGTVAWQRGLFQAGTCKSTVPAPAGGWFVLCDQLYHVTASGEVTWRSKVSSKPNGMVARGDHLIVFGTGSGNGSGMPWLSEIDGWGKTHWSRSLDLDVTAPIRGLTVLPAGGVAVYGGAVVEPQWIGEGSPWGHFSCATAGNCFAKSLADCPGGGPCQTSECEAPGVCVTGASEGLGCDDGNPCTVGDGCAGATCASGEAIPLSAKFGGAGDESVFAAARALDGTVAVAGIQDGNPWLRATSGAGKVIFDDSKVVPIVGGSIRAIAWKPHIWFVAGEKFDVAGTPTGWSAFIHVTGDLAEFTAYPPTSTLRAVSVAVNARRVAGQRTAQDGNAQAWLRTVQGEGSAAPDQLFGQPDASEAFHCLAVAVDGHGIAAGERTKQGKTDPYLVRFDAKGQKLWEFTQGTVEADPVLAVTLLNDDSVVAAGPAHIDGAGDGFLLKLDAAGKQLWRHKVTIGVSGGTIAALEPVKSGFLLAGGTAGATGNGWLGVANHAGGLLDSAPHGGAGKDEFHALVRLPGGRFLAAGASSSNSKGGLDGWVVNANELNLQPTCDPADKCLGVGFWESDDGNDCTVAGCTAGQVTQGATLAICDDGTVCTEGDFCTDKACKGGAATYCDDGNVCTQDLCELKTGKCSNVVMADGATCGSVAVPCVALTCKKGICGSASGETGLWTTALPGGTVADAAVRPGGGIVTIGFSTADAVQFARLDALGKVESQWSEKLAPGSKLSTPNAVAVASDGSWVGVGQCHWPQADGLGHFSARVWAFSASGGLVSAAADCPFAGASDRVWSDVVHRGSGTMVLAGTFSGGGWLNALNVAPYMPGAAAPDPGPAGPFAKNLICMTSPKLAAAPDGSVYVACGTLVARFDQDLQTAWTRNVAPTLYNVTAVAAHPQGGAVVAGHAGLVAPVEFTYWSASGLRVWKQQIVVQMLDTLRDLVVAEGTGVAWLVSSSEASRIGLLSLDGSPQWSRNLSGTKFGTTITREPSGMMYLAAGSTIARLDAFGHASCAEAGSCAQKPLIACDDNNPCTADDCTAKSGCTKTPQPDTAACEDSFPCTSGDLCKAGKCTAGSQPTMGVGVLASPPSESVAAMVPDGNGGFLLAGSADSAMAAMHLDGSGKPIGGVTVVQPDSTARASAVVAAGGQWVLAGSATDKTGKETWLLAAHKTSGEPVWEAKETDAAVKTSRLTGAVAVGNSVTVVGWRFQTGNDAWVARWSLSGKPVWQTAFATAAHETLDAVVVSGAGQVLAVGAKAVGAAGYEGWSVRLDAAGKVLLESVVAATPGADRFYAVTALADGSVVALGEQDAIGKPKPWLVRLDASLKVLWQRTWPHTPGNRLDALLALPPHGFALAGRKDATTGWVVRTDAFGNDLWQWTGTANKGLHVSGLLPEANGGLVVAGTAVNDLAKASGDVWFGRVGPWGYTACAAAGACAAVAAGATESGGKCLVENCDPGKGVVTKPAAAGAPCGSAMTCQGTPPTCKQ